MKEQKESTYNPLVMPHKLTPELEAYYGNRRLMWRNVLWFMLLNAGWSVSFTVVNPLMTLRMNSAEIGMGEAMIGNIMSLNGYAVGFLVMYFSWKSDHTVSRWGRRIPYLWISAPFIITTVILFPYITDKWALLGVLVVYLFFMDLKSSTISLLPIDLVPRSILARINSFAGIILSVLSFLAMRYGMKLSDHDAHLPFVLGGCVLILTTLVGGFGIKEPPIRDPATEPFKPWSALKVGWRDKRMAILMLSGTMLGALGAMYNGWIWLYAKNVLNLTRTEMGASLSWASLLGIVLAFPCAWLVDRISPFKLAGVYLALNFVMFAALMLINSASGLIFVSFLFVLTASFGGATSMMIWRSAHPAEVGCVTSSAAFVSQVFGATIMLISGQLIERLGHNYKAAFILGISITTVGFFLLFYYRYLMIKGGPLKSMHEKPPGRDENTGIPSPEETGHGAAVLPV